MAISGLFYMTNFFPKVPGSGVGSELKSCRTLHGVSSKFLSDFLFDGLLMTF